MQILLDLVGIFLARAADIGVVEALSTKRPPFFCANSQLNSAVRALPIWMLPVGDGAKRTVTVMAVEVAKAGADGKERPPQSSSRPSERSECEPGPIGREIVEARPGPRFVMVDEGGAVLDD